VTGEGHLPFPCLGPAVAIPQATNYPEGLQFLARNPLLPQPAPDGTISGVGETIAGFFMTPELGNASLTVQRLQNGKCFSDANHQRLANGRQRLLQFLQTLPDEAPLPS